MTVSVSNENSLCVRTEYHTSDTRNGSMERLLSFIRWRRAKPPATSTIIENHCTSLTLPIPLRRTIVEGPRGPVIASIEQRRVSNSGGLTPVVKGCMSPESLPSRSFSVGMKSGCCRPQSAISPSFAGLACQGVGVRTSY